MVVTSEALYVVHWGEVCSGGSMGGAEGVIEIPDGGLQNLTPDNFGALNHTKINSGPHCGSL